MLRCYPTKSDEFIQGFNSEFLRGLPFSSHSTNLIKNRWPLIQCYSFSIIWSNLTIWHRLTIKKLIASPFILDSNSLDSRYMYCFNNLKPNSYPYYFSNTNTDNLFMKTDSIFMNNIRIQHAKRIPVYTPSCKSATCHSLILSFDFSFVRL